MAKIFITRPIPEPALELLKEAGHSVEVGEDRYGLSKKKLVKILKKSAYDGLLSLLTDPIDKDVIDAFGGKVIANYAVGFNNIDVEYAKSKGIVVTNTPLGSDSVAEFAAGLILTLSKRIAEADEFARKGKYKAWDPYLFLGHDLRGKVLGVVGTGRIGAATARIMSQGFKMNVVYYDVVKNETIERECHARLVSLEELLEISDVVTLHVPLMPATTHLISKERLALMRKGAMLVNTARGPVVDEHALEEALVKGQIGGAALDVHEFEPKVSKKLAKLPNVVLTPHIASATEEARRDMARKAASNIVAVLGGREPLNPVK